MTKYKEGPWWMYKRSESEKDRNMRLTMTPSTLSTLVKLKKMGLILIILSTSPQSRKKAYRVLRQKVRHFGIEGLIDEIHPTRDEHGSKGTVMTEILKRKRIPKSKAIMVGDSYNYDYKPAIDNGIDAILIESDYVKLNTVAQKTIRTIKRLNNILEYI